MEYKDLLFEKDDHIAVITLNRPQKMNALGPDLRESFKAAMKAVEDDDEVRVGIITGAGRGFCSGADVGVQAARASGEVKDTGRKEILALVGDFILAFENLNKPIIAAINGVAAGVGLTLTLACDIRMASVDARFSAIWVKRGLIPDGGATFLLPHVVGMDNALRLSYTGDIIDAREAERIKLVTSVVPAETLVDQAKGLARQIAAMPPITVGVIKKIMWEEIRANMKKALLFESYGQNLCRETQDQKEAVKAFMEKRAPRFKGV